MPKVPTYDTFQAGVSGLPNVQVRAPDMPDVAGQQTQQMGQALTRAGDAAGRIAQDMFNDANQVRITAAMNQAVKARTDLQVQALQLRGKDALERPGGKSLPDEFNEKLDEHIRGISQGLGNDEQRRIFGMQAGQLGAQFFGALSTHMVAQQDEYKTSTIKGTIETAQDQAALLWGDAAMRQQSRDAIAAAVGDLAKLKGWGDNDKMREAALVDALSPMHQGVMSGLIKAGRAAEAKSYYESNSAEMTLQARSTMQSAIKDANDTQTAEGAADAVWGEIGPKTSNEAVRIFDMDAKMRERLKDNPDALKLGLAALHQRAQAFNTQQAETNAAGVNSVFKLIDSGTPMSQVMRSDAWLALPDIKRHEIRKSIEAQSLVRTQHAAAREQMKLAELQRTDALALRNNADAYLIYSDPAVLSQMSRTQVQALRTTFGFDAVQTLVGRWDTLQKADGKLEAQIDTDTFNQVASDMGLKPFEQHKSDDDRKQLGALKYRIEKLIEVAQTSKKAALTRTEKEELVRGEMARTVTLHNWFSPNKDVPVIALKPAQVGDVMVPAADRAQIVEALKVMYQRQPSNPLYAPTDDNVRRLYLMNKSKAGGLIDGK